MVTLHVHEASNGYVVHVQKTPDQIGNDPMPVMFDPGTEFIAPSVEDVIAIVQKALTN